MIIDIQEFNRRFDCVRIYNKSPFERGRTGLIIGEVFISGKDYWIIEDSRATAPHITEKILK